MRTTLKPALIAISLLAFVYSGCQKSANKAPAATTSAITEADEETMATSIAQNFSGSLSGLASVKTDGTSVAAANGRPQTEIPRAASLCGFVDEYNITAYPSNIIYPFFYNSITDKLSSVSGLFKYNNVCDAGTLDGYDMVDSLHITGTGLLGAFTSYFVQNFVVKTLNTTYTDFSLSGYVTSQVDKGAGVKTYDLYSKTLYQPGMSFKATAGRSELSGTANFYQKATFVPIGSKTGQLVTSVYYGTYTFAPDFALTITFLQNGKPEVFHFFY
jgi:hypothetical protein